MTIPSAMDLSDLVRAKPWEVAASAAVLLAVTLAVGRVLSGTLRGSRSVRRQVVALAIGSLAIGALAGVLAARLMLLDSSELRALLTVLAVAAAFATLLAVLVARPISADVGRLESTVRAIDAGDRGARSGIERADEIGRVARALDRLNDRLDQLERERALVEEERRALLSSVGHDLRTPLASLRAAIEALADGVASDPDRFVRAMQHDVAALGALVDDLFLLARLDAGRAELEQVVIDLAELADETLDGLAPIAAARGVELRLDAPTSAPIEGSPYALARVVRNLVDNAIRHAPAGSVVEVAVSPSAERGGVVVRVRDEGPGFPAGFRDHAFERFTRADAARSRAAGGAGLGLSIARGLVEAHGGSIWIDDVERGAAVAFLIPA